MNTDLGDQLERLAPSVNPVTAWTCFEEGRRRARRRRAIGGGVVSAAFATVLVIGGYSIATRDQGRLVETSPLNREQHPPSETVDFERSSPPGVEQPSAEVPHHTSAFHDGPELDHRVVTIVEPGGPIDPERPPRLPELAAEIRVLIGQDSLDDLWLELGLDQATLHHEGAPFPQIDFEVNVAFIVTEGRPAACADDLDLDLDRDSDVLWFRFEPFSGGCHTRQGWTIYVVEARRSQLPNRFTIERDYYGLEPPHPLRRQQVTLSDLAP